MLLSRLLSSLDDSTTVLFCWGYWDHLLFLSAVRPLHSCCTPPCMFISCCPLHLELAALFLPLLLSPPSLLARPASLLAARLSSTVLLARPLRLFTTGRSPYSLLFTTGRSSLPATLNGLQIRVARASSIRQKSTRSGFYRQES
jgi:hypothetical protein